MARNYPKFIYSNVTNAKSNGEFIMHVLEPAFLAKVVHGKAITMEVVQTYNMHDLDIQPILDRMVQWYVAVHLQQSNANKHIEGLKTKDAFLQVISQKGIAKQLGIHKQRLNSARQKVKNGNMPIQETMQEYLIMAGWQKVSEEMWIDSNDVLLN